MQECRGLLEKWLDGKTLKERVPSLETGTLWACMHCNDVFFDKESEDERSLRPCSPGKKHEVVERGNYVILERGFRHILDAVFFNSSKSTMEDAIIRHFKRQEMVARQRASENDTGRENTIN